MPTVGELNWCFEMTIHNIEDESQCLCVPCYKGCGDSMFKLTPDAFEALPPSKQADLKESWCGVPIISGLMLKIDDAQDKATLFLYNLKRLPEQYMREVDIKD